MFVNSWITSEIFKMLIPLIFPSLGDLLEHSTSNSRAWCCSEERPHPKILHRRNWIYVVRKMTEMIILLQVLVLKSYGMLVDKLVQEIEDVDPIYTIFISILSWASNYMKYFKYCTLLASDMYPDNCWWSTNWCSNCFTLLTIPLK